MTNLFPGSWQPALIVALLLVIAFGAWLVFRPRKRNRRVQRPVRQPAQVIDFYVEKRAAMIDWLGDDYLLAKPINQRGSKPPKSTPASFRSSINFQS